MDKLLWLVSSLVMVGLLLCLAGRGLKELFGLELALPERRERVSLAEIPTPVIFFTALVVLWLGAFGGYLAVNGGSVEGFFAHFYRRFTEAGDSPHYLYIAENGYVGEGENAKNIVFYPLYPFLMGLLGKLLGNTALAGIVISQVCYGFAAVILARLLCRTCEHPGWGLAAFLFYPFGFFSLGVFTEGLFLLLTVLGLYFIQERKWLLAGLAAFLCALCRTQGILLLLPGIYVAWRDAREGRWNRKCLAMLGAVLGFFVYLCINKIVCGEFFAYQYYESIEPWWQTPQWLGKTLAQQWTMGLDYPGLADWIYWPQLFLYFIGAALLFAGWRERMDMPWLLYGTAYLGMCYTASWLISGGRYMLGCIPLYLCVGRLRGKTGRFLLLAAEVGFFCLYNYYYMQGQAIM